MNKNLMVALAAVLSLGISSCKDNTNTSASSSSKVDSSTPISSSSSSQQEFTEEELAEAKEYLKENRSACSLNGGLHNEYCTEGEKTLVIPKAGKNRKNHLGDISIMDGTSAQVAPAEAINGSEFNEENDPVFRDWKLNACTVTPTLSICSNVKNKKYDDSNVWNYRMMVDETGKIVALYAGGQISLPTEPYFSNFAYDKNNNDNMFVVVKADDRYTKIPGDEEGVKHAYAWQIPDNGFNILEHPDHRNGRYADYLFTDSSEVDLITWAFMGAGNDTTIGTFKKSTEHFTAIGSTDDPVANDPIYYYKNSVWATSLGKLFIPGQFDDVKIQQEEEKDELGVATGNYVITETFHYDPWTTYQKFKAYKDYLEEIYNGEAADATLDAKWQAIDNETEVEEAIYNLNTKQVREGSEELIAQYTTAAVRQLQKYKISIIEFRYELFQISEL